MDLKDKTVLIAGMALSGTAAARALHELGAKLILHDSKPLDQLSQTAREKIATLSYEDFLGRDARSALDRADLVVVSPGLPPTLPLLLEAHVIGIPVISEIELGYEMFASGTKLVAITGTNGKTTTTALTGQIFTDAGHNTFVLGNIGIPISERAAETKAGDIVVAETAALQLDDITEYHPAACALLNITEDHLNRYQTMERYAAAKARVFENQTEDDWCILNRDDPLVSALAPSVPSRIVWFSLRPVNGDGVFLDGDIVKVCLDGRTDDLLPAEEIRIPGVHNLQNAMAAAALAHVLGTPLSGIADTLRTFPGVEHRIETVCEKRGVLFINDSKGTNPDATEKAIAAMKGPTVLILGGYDKHSDFGPLMEIIKASVVRHIVVLGATAPKILAAAKEAGIDSVSCADSFDDAVRMAASAARDGETVLLSPACASWDMFENFEQRGARFKKLVEDL